MTLNDLEIQKSSVLVIFFRDLMLRRTFEEWIFADIAELLAIDQDNLRIKLN